MQSGRMIKKQIPLSTLSGTLLATRGTMRGSHCTQSETEYLWSQDRTESAARLPSGTERCRTRPAGPHRDSIIAGRALRGNSARHRSDHPLAFLQQN